MKTTVHGYRFTFGGWLATCKVNTCDNVPYYVSSWPNVHHNKNYVWVSEIAFKLFLLFFCHD